MDEKEIQQKADELDAILVKYKSDLGVLEKELLSAITAYHAAVKERMLKDLKKRMFVRER